VVKIAQLTTKDMVIELTSEDKSGVLEELVRAISRSKEVTDREGFLKALLEREKILSTGLGMGAAVPHAKIDSVNNFVLSVGLSKTGVEFDALDGKPVHLFFMIAGPQGQQGLYLRVLARVCMLVKNDQFRKQLMNARTAEELYDLLKDK